MHLSRSEEKTNMSQENIGRLVVFVHPSLKDGPILIAEGIFLNEISQVGWDLGDYAGYIRPVPSMAGLLIFDGWIESTSGPEPDSWLVGCWRRVTVRELLKIAVGERPWEEGK